MFMLVAAVAFSCLYTVLLQSHRITLATCSGLVKELSTVTCSAATATALQELPATPLKPPAVQPTTTST
jgi:hypothetical protein